MRSCRRCDGVASCACCRRIGLPFLRGAGFSPIKAEKMLAATLTAVPFAPDAGRALLQSRRHARVIGFRSCLLYRPSPSLLRALAQARVLQLLRCGHSRQQLAQDRRSAAPRRRLSLLRCVAPRAVHAAFGNSGSLRIRACRRAPAPTTSFRAQPERSCRFRSHARLQSSLALAAAGADRRGGLGSLCRSRSAWRSS